MYPIELQNVSRKYGRATVVDDLSFTVREGVVTGFLGPNGAGKSTTLRMVVGLTRPNNGAALVKGKPYRALTNPCHQVGVVMESGSFHPGRSGRNHLRWVAQAVGADKARVEQMLELVQLDDAAAKKRVGGYSLGMRQRLALATAMLPDPEILVLDEPANGLDPQGIRWMRDLLVNMAKEGRTVLVSSHLLQELAQFAEDVVVINKGRMVTQGTVAQVTGESAGVVRVRSPQIDDLVKLAESESGRSHRINSMEFTISDITPERIGELAAQSNIVLHRLEVESRSLEDVFLNLTNGATQ